MGIILKLKLSLSPQAFLKTNQLGELCSVKNWKYELHMPDKMSSEQIFLKYELGVRYLLFK